MTTIFTGFSPESMEFFEKLAANNNKLWFEDHRDDFEQYLTGPLKSLVSDLSDTMLAIDPELVTIPTVDKTISRIYRDTRFSRNKSPYKTCLWITFKRRGSDWKSAPPVSSSRSAPTVTVTAWASTALPGRQWTVCGGSLKPNQPSSGRAWLLSAGRIPSPWRVTATNARLIRPCRMTCNSGMAARISTSSASVRWMAGSLRVGSVMICERGLFCSSRCMRCCGGCVGSIG